MRISTNFCRPLFDNVPFLWYSDSKNSPSRLSSKIPLITCQPKAIKKSQEYQKKKKKISFKFLPPDLYLHPLISVPRDNWAVDVAVVAVAGWSTRERWVRRFLCPGTGFAVEIEPRVCWASPTTRSELARELFEDLKFQRRWDQPDDVVVVVAWFVARSRRGWACGPLVAGNLNVNL